MATIVGISYSELLEKTGSKKEVKTEPKKEVKKPVKKAKEE